VEQAPVEPKVQQRAPAGYAEQAALTQSDHQATLPVEPAPQPQARLPQPQQAYAPQARQQIAHQDPVHQQQPAAPVAPRSQQEPTRSEQPAASQPQGHSQAAAHRSTEGNASAIQQSIARIHEACQAPPISPPEYRVLFDVMAEEINANGLTGTQTLVNICQRAKDLGVEIRKDDARFILEVVSEADPWFEQGASANLFSSRFRNFVIARCKSQGLQLSATELDLIEAWFTGVAPRVAAQKEPMHDPEQSSVGDQQHARSHTAGQSQPGYAEPGRQQDWFAGEQSAQPQTALAPEEAPNFGRYTDSDEDFPRVLRNRNRA